MIKYDTYQIGYYSMKKECKKCGSCCVQYKGTYASEEDIRRWNDEYRIDILQYCRGWKDEYRLILGEDKLVSYFTEGLHREMWFDPKTKVRIRLCPFLRKKYGKNKFECMVHDTKPELCRNYICDPKDMRKIIKKQFDENLKEYRKKRKMYPSFIRTSPFIGNPLK